MHRWRSSADIVSHGPTAAAMLHGVRRVVAHHRLRHVIRVTFARWRGAKDR